MPPSRTTNNAPLNSGSSTGAPNSIVETDANGNITATGSITGAGIASTGPLSATGTSTLSELDLSGNLVQTGAFSISSGANGIACNGPFTSTGATLKNGEGLVMNNTSNTFSTTLQQGAAAANVTLNLPITADTLVGRATTDTLTNKSISGGTINSATVGATTPAAGTFTTLTAGQAFFTTSGTVPAIANLQAGVGSGPAGNFPFVQSYSAAGAGTALQLNPIGGSVITFKNTLDDGSGDATFIKATLKSGNGLVLNNSGNTFATTLQQGAATSNVTLNLPITADTLVGRATADTLTNKAISGGTIDNAVIGGTAPGAGTFTSVSTGSAGLVCGGTAQINSGGTTVSTATGAMIVRQVAATPTNYAGIFTNNIGAAASTDANGIILINASAANSSSQINLDMSNYLPPQQSGSNPAIPLPTTRIQDSSDGNSSGNLIFYAKTPGNTTNALAQTALISSSGQFQSGSGGISCAGPLILANGSHIRVQQRTWSLGTTAPGTYEFNAGNSTGGAGTGATITSIFGDDSAGTVSFTAGTSPQSGFQIITINFFTPFATLIQSAVVSCQISYLPLFTTVNKNSLTFFSNTALTAGDSYTFNWMVIGQ